MKIKHLNGAYFRAISCKMNCNMEDKYSKEWKQVNIAYNEYRQSLALFLACDEEQIYNDLSKSLRNRKDEQGLHITLKVMMYEYIPEKIQIRLLDDLFFVMLNTRVSSSALAKNIILALNQSSDKEVIIKEQIIKLVDKYALFSKDNWELFDIANLLYSLKYKDKFASFTKEYIKALMETGFVDNESELSKLLNSIKDN
ncbi:MULTISPECIES: hypothetical protein [Bacteroides]|mgnify:FL=1|nr:MULTISPECIES: hypothetical protein [Bacteroides]MCM0259672.1 hypothetical protein [Bacteroides fragilis]MCM0306538.1 hypothetical protein [Bacteroides fragilis]MCM0310171.1 hypothetical protein [Bacteroides fragilis]MCM0318278.1 hypothetical protein [Bacteroides fragilis]MCM0329870.1 hypothetical protein [Bacteroides fragilis]